MIQELVNKFTTSNIIPERYKPKVVKITNDYIENNDISNHRKKKYVFGGSVLFILHNRTNKLFRPTEIAERIGANFSPSKITAIAYKIASHFGEKYQKPQTNEFAHYYARKLDCSQSVHDCIDKIYEETGELPGKSNSGTGAAIVYIASKIEDEKQTQSSLSELSGRSEVGIRKIYYEVSKQTTLHPTIEKG